MMYYDVRVIEEINILKSLLSITVRKLLTFF